MFIEWFIHTDEYTKEELLALIKITSRIEPEITKMIKEAIRLDDYAKVPK